MFEDATDKIKKLKESDYPSIISAIRSPLSLFGLIMLVCNGVFAISAAWMKDIEAFKYAIHMFLAIVGAFFLLALWTPRSLYHPRELQGLGDDISGPRLPKIIVTLVLLLAMFSYGGYQVWKVKTEQKAAVQEELDKSLANRVPNGGIRVRSCNATYDLRKTKPSQA
jgi:hypothetical protein